MSKEEFLKIQTCVLKVNIHCDGCKSKVKKTLQKIDGVYKIHIDSEMGKVTVSGNVDPATLIKKLGKSGKHAELWGPPKANQGNQNQFKNQHIDNGKSGNKGQKGGGNQQKAGGGGGSGGQPGLNPQQQLQLLQMKGLQNMKLPLKMPFSKDQNQKAVKFNLAEEDDMSDDEFDDCFDDEDYDDDDELDDEFGGALNPAPNKMKPIMGNGQMPNLMMLNGQQLPPQFMNAQAKGGNGANNNGGNGKKGGGGNVPIQVNDGKNDHGGKKGGGGGGGKNGGKNGGGNPGEGKNGNNSGGAQSKNGNGGHGGGGGGNCNNNGNGGKKGGGMNDGVQGLPNMGSGFQGMAGGHLGQMGGMPMGQMGHLPMGQMGHLPMGQMGQMPAVQGLPAGPLNAGGGGGGVGGYLNGAGQEGLAGNSYQQHLAAAMMNQQRANGNERFQPMMYARPPPAVNYMPPPYQYPYPYPPPPDHPYTHAFSDESTSSCSVM